MSAAGTLRRFGFKQALKGAVILGLVAGFMLTIQGVAYQKAYPTAAEQHKFAVSLEAAPALGFLYGDASNLAVGASGYMVYRVMGFMGVIVSIWGLMVVTRLLRGNEEEGRWEILRTGTLTPRGTSVQVLIGFSGTWLVSLLISLILTMLATSASDITLSTANAILLNFMIYIPGLLFGAIGVLTSQLALTRQRAIMYGLIPVVGLFLVRGVGNVEHSLHWLMALTPFGWSELVNPVVNNDLVWILPFATFTPLFAILGIRLANRDLGSSLLKQSDFSKSHFLLLRNGWQLALRQNGWVFVGWGTLALFMTGLIAALTNTAMKVSQDSGGLSDSVKNLGGNSQDLKIAFLGAGLVFLVMVLLIMAATVIGEIRRDEAKQYLDNVLVNPRRRTDWMISRLLLGSGIILMLSLLSGLLTYVVATTQGVNLDLVKVLATSFSAVGTIIFLLGLGALCYGFRPRLATAIMYFVIIWSFIITLVASATKLNSVLLHSSLFQYVTFNLAAWPAWGTFAWMIVLGIIMATAGTYLFNRRDIIYD